MGIAIAFNVLAGFVFLFLFWRKLREDYTSTQIFTTAIYVLVAGAIGIGLALKFAPAWWFWCATLGIVAGFGLGLWRFQLRAYEALDALIFALLPWLAIFFLADSIVNLALSSLVASAVVFLIAGLYWYLDNQYKNFSWYKSGKVGFAGLASAGILFLLRAALAFPFNSVLSFAGRFEAILSAIMAFIFFLLVFNLSRQI